MTFKLTFAKTFAYAALAAFLPISAQAAEKSTFSADGISFEYSTIVKNGRKVIFGRTSDGRSFRLLVSETDVTGKFSGQPIAFKLADVRLAQVAAR